MIVDGVRLEQRGDAVRLVADVSWEDRCRDRRELWYAVPAEHAVAMSPRGDPFLVSCAVLAQHHGERRLRLTGEVCPRLVEGTRTALAWLRHWYHPDRPGLRIEAPLDSDARPPVAYRSGLFLSGGVDPLFCSCRNHRRVPVGHPHRFTQAVVIDGIETYRSARFDRAIRELADATGLELVRPSTNLRSLERHATAGLCHLVIAWPSSWWLDVYGELATWLDSNHRGLLRTERVTVYELGVPAR